MLRYAARISEENDQKIDWPSFITGHFCKFYNSISLGHFSDVMSLTSVKLVIFAYSYVLDSGADPGFPVGGGANHWHFCQPLLCYVYHSHSEIDRKYFLISELIIILFVQLICHISTRKWNLYLNTKNANVLIEEN